MADERTEAEPEGIGGHVAARVDELGAVIPLVKAHLVGGELGSSRQLQQEGRSAFVGQGALEPPYDPDMLCLLHEHSNSLRQNVDAYATNIDGFGHRFDPVFDLDAEDAKEELAAELSETHGTPNIDGLTTAGDVVAIIEKLRAEMRKERRKLERFFKFAVHDMSFVQLRKQTRQDLEIIGNAYWEVVRNNGGHVTRFVYVPAHTMRLMPLIGEPATVEETIASGLFATEKRTVQKRFRRFVQQVEARFVMFKEFGDPRVVSNKSGKVYQSVEMLNVEEPNARPANEIIHFKIPSPRSPYGVPRWIGNLLSVLGSRQTEEINFLYFENKSVPPMAILVSGGRISKDSVTRIRDFIETHIKGKRNFHKVMIIEAEPAIGNSISNEASSRVKVEIKPLLGAQHADALFMKYDENNRDKIGESFRVPRLLRGDMRDFNRSTAFAALSFAEQQVFQPERSEFDFVMNRKVLPELGVRWHEFASLAPITRDPVAMSEMLKNFSNANILVPEETRELAADVFNRTFKKITSFWTQQPAAFTLAGFDFTGKDPIMPTTQPNAAPENGASEKGGKFGALSSFASMLVQLRRELRVAQDRERVQAFERAHDAVNGDEEVIRMSLEEMERNLGVTPSA